MSDAMDSLMIALYMGKVPETWARFAWPSMRDLSSWLNNFMQRLVQLEEWSSNPTDIPKVRR
jgi:dynein heavy chain